MLDQTEFEGYIEFTAWYEMTVQEMIERGSNHLHASAYLAQSLLEHYLQTTVLS